MNSIFETWTFDGVKFLALRNPQGYHIISEAGGNYGNWQTVERFRKEQRINSEMAKPLMIISSFSVAINR